MRIKKLLAVALAAAMTVNLKHHYSDTAKKSQCSYFYKSESKTDGYCNGGWLESWKPIGSSKQWYTK